MSRAHPPEGLSTPILGIEIDPAGSHPAAWRLPGSEPDRLLDPTFLVALTQIAERGGLTFASFPCTQALPPADGATTLPRASGDAVGAAGRLARLTTTIGLVPEVDAVGGPGDADRLLADAATLDHLSRSRTAVQVATASDLVTLEGRPAEHAADPLRLGGDVFTPVPEPRTARRVPLVAVVEDDDAARTAGRIADVVRIRARDEGSVTALAAAVRDAASDAGRPVARGPGEEAALRILVEVAAVLGPETASARARLSRLADQPGHARGAWTSGLVHAGTATDLARRVEEWWTSGVVDGVWLLGAAAPADVVAVVDGVVPVLAARGLADRPAPGTPLTRRLALAGLGAARGALAGTGAR